MQYPPIASKISVEILAFPKSKTPSKYPANEEKTTLIAKRAFVMATKFENADGFWANIVVLKAEYIGSNIFCKDRTYIPYYKTTLVLIFVKY
jgi:hypothetical protein